MKIALVVETRDAVALEVLLLTLARDSEERMADLAGRNLPRTAAIIEKQAIEARALATKIAEAIRVAKHVD